MQRTEILEPDTVTSAIPRDITSAIETDTADLSSKHKFKFVFLRTVKQKVKPLLKVRNERLFVLFYFVSFYQFCTTVNPSKETFPSYYLMSVLSLWRFIFIYEFVCLFVGFFFVFVFCLFVCLFLPFYRKKIKL